MRVGLDFDNTIVSYDTLFKRVALEDGVVPADLPATKLAVRDHLRQAGKEDVWTEMQGHVYGGRMAEAEAFPGALAFIRWAKAKGVTLFIISHKTRTPFRGPAYDLHRAARTWVERNLAQDGDALIPPDHVFFEVTKEDKLRRIADCRCDLFIDDLPEILLAPNFPAATGRLLFDPDHHHENVQDLTTVDGWDALRRNLEVTWPRTH